MMRAISETWAEDLIAFAKGHRKASSQTLADYCTYIQNVATRLGTSVGGLVCDENAFIEIGRRIDKCDEWSNSTKADYRTALNLLWEYRTSDVQCSSIGSNTTTGDPCVGIFAEKIMQQVNEVEEKAIDNEYSVCKLVFGLLSTYTLALPALSVKAQLSPLPLVLLMICVLLSLGSLVCFLPIMMRPARHFREIKAVGESMIKSGRGSFCCNPEWWNSREVLAAKGAGACILLSIVFLFAAVWVDRLMKG